MSLYYKFPTTYYKYVYSPYTLPTMTSQTAPEGTVDTNFVLGKYSKNLYGLFWNTSGWYIDINANTSANRYINYIFKKPLPPGTYTLSCKMKTQNNVTSTGYHWDIICDDGNGGNRYITVGDPGIPPKTNTDSDWPSGSSYSWTFTTDLRIKAVELKINSPSVSSSSYICLFVNNLNLTCTSGLKIQTGVIEATSADYDYSVPNFVKIRDYMATGVYRGSTPIGFIHKNNQLLYKGRHYESWEMPSNPDAKGYTLQGNPTENLAALFDKSSSTFRWGQGVSNRSKWFSIIFPFPVIIDAITVKQGYTGTHDDCRTYRVKFRAESTGADGTGEAVYITNQTSLSWDVDSSTSIPIIAKPICKRVYCDCKMQEYGTLNEVYITGRRVL